MSSTPDENIVTAKNFIGYMNTVDEKKFPLHYYRLQELKNEVSTLYEEYNELSTLQPNDELYSIAEEECAQIVTKIRGLLKTSSKFLDAMNKYDAQDAYMEVTAGAGGLEAGVFAGEILQLYLGYINSMGFEHEIVEWEDIPVSSALKQSSARPTARTKISVMGNNVFGTLKYECGVHRVQRVPVTGTKSDRLQTSTCSVSVYPKPNDEAITIDPKDIKMESMRSSGKGGQHVNTTDSACRLTHLPTGTSVKCQEERSLEQNRRKAMEYLKSALYNQQYESELAAVSKARKSQIGNMNRNEKIRSYNFNRNQITDHRISEIRQVANLTQFLRGAYGYEILSDFHEILTDVNTMYNLKTIVEKNKTES